MSLNIWDKQSFQMAGLGHKCKLFAKIKYIGRCIKWSKQRIVRGYADIDVWNMYGYLEQMIPDMLQFLRNNRVGSPGYLALSYPDEDVHAVWDRQLDEMISLWRDSNEETCSRKNPYEEEHTKAFDEFVDKYGFLGEKLQTEFELEENRKCGGGGTVHFMKELPEYKDLDEKYQEEERKLEQYRLKCKDMAMDLLKEHFYSLWD